MQPRQRLLHSWDAQVRALLPTVRVSRVRVLALLVLGAIWAGQLTLLRVAAALPLPAADASTERRFQRWLANPHVVVGELWPALLPALLAAHAGAEVVCVFDPTPHNETATILCLGVVAHRRVLPLAWRVVPQQEPWPARQIAYLRAMITEVAAALPPGCTVTLVADRGITGPEVIDLCREVGWHFVLRTSDRTFAPVPIEVSNPQAPEPVEMTVIGVIESGIGSLFGLYTSQDTVDAIYPPGQFTQYSLQLSDPALAEEKAEAIEAALLMNGAQANSIQAELEEAQRQNTNFLYIIQGFMGLGLIVGVDRSRLLG